jgi:protoporphyrinogen/coproporphyrinogen III oxidase
VNVVIVGGGITGLTAAYRLLQARDRGGPALRVTVLEREAALGGNIRTEARDGFVIDGGPDAWVAAKPYATALARELGLGDQLIGTTAANRKLYIQHHGELHTFPEGVLLTVPTQIVPFMRSRLISWPGKARMALDLALPRARGAADESLAHFVRRRLGREALERLAEPLMGGIYAGDVEALSIRSTFPQLVEMEEKHGSLIRGAVALLASRGHGKGAPPPSAFFGLRGGMGDLIHTIRDRIAAAGAEIRLGARCAAISRPKGGILAPPSPRYLVRVESGSSHEVIPADAVLLAAPAYEAASAVDGLDPEMAKLLREIPYLSTATIVLAYRRADVPHRLDAVGVILPKAEGRRILAATFISSKWEHRAPEGSALLRVFVGGDRDPRALEQGDDALVDLARAELAAVLDVRAAPLFTRVFRFERANAQPVVGHQDRLRRLRRREEQHPGLHLAGAAFEGVGIPDCVRQANEAAAKIAATRGSPG